MQKVRTLNQGNGHAYELVEFVQPQTTELDLTASIQVDPLCATTSAMTTEILLRNVAPVAALGENFIPPPATALTLTTLGSTPQCCQHLIIIYEPKLKSFAKAVT